MKTPTDISRFFVRHGFILNLSCLAAALLVLVFRQSEASTGAHSDTGASIGTIAAAKAAERNAPANTDAHYLDVPVEQVLKTLDDPQQRVNKMFHVPPEAKPIVGFWLKIYAKYSLYQTLVYDKNHHDVVYEVVDSRDLFNRGLSPVAQEITAKARLKKVLAEHKAACRKLQGHPSRKFAANSIEAKLVKIWGKRSKREWREIEENIRTQAGQRDRIMQGLATADRFFPAMEAIFERMKLPIEITRLPMVESSFNVQAKSKADAVGVWQFLEKSAMEYLVVDSYNKIDERLSPIKSTYAAARMFKRNYKLLEDWGLAIIAYNHGARNLIPIRNKFRGQQIAKLLKETKKTPLGYASRSFFAEFLAILHAERYRDELYGMSTKRHSSAISIVRMKKPASIFEVASLYNISINELRVFNPDIFDLKRRLPAGTRVVLPRKHGESIVMAPQSDDSSKNVESDGGRGIASEFEFIEYIKN